MVTREQIAQACLELGWGAAKAKELLEQLQKPPHWELSNLPFDPEVIEDLPFVEAWSEPSQ